MVSKTITLLHGSLQEVIDLLNLEYCTVQSEDLIAAVVNIARRVDAIEQAQRDQDNTISQMRFEFNRMQGGSNDL